MKEMVGGCCVCSDERGWTENPLVYCDGQGCNVAVHQACYGIVSVPTGPWFCRKCESQERTARVRCELCPSRDGALKRTDTQAWAHVVCALYIPEVRFGNVATMEPIMLQLIPAERFNKVCYICEEEGRSTKAAIGACMQCNRSGCKQNFHVTCAQALGLLCEEAGNYLDNVKYCGYCQHHYSKLKKGAHLKIIPPYKPVSVDASDSSPEKELDTNKSGAGSRKKNNNRSGSATGPKVPQSREGQNPAELKLAPIASGMENTVETTKVATAAVNKEVLPAAVTPTASVVSGSKFTRSNFETVANQGENGFGIDKRLPTVPTSSAGARKRKAGSRTPTSGLSLDNGSDSNPGGFQAQTVSSMTSVPASTVPSSSLVTSNVPITAPLDALDTTGHLNTLIEPKAEPVSPVRTALTSVTTFTTATASALVSSVTSRAFSMGTNSPVGSITSLNTTSTLPGNTVATIAPTVHSPASTLPSMVSAAPTLFQQLQQSIATNNTPSSSTPNSEPAAEGLPEETPAKRPRSQSSSEKSDRSRKQKRGGAVSVTSANDNDSSSIDATFVAAATTSTSAMIAKNMKSACNNPNSSDTYSPPPVISQTHQASILSAPHQSATCNTSMTQLSNVMAMNIKRESPPSSPSSECMSSASSSRRSRSRRSGKERDEKDIKPFQNGINAPHMLGNQLNPSSSMAQKMSDTLNAELEAHSVFHDTNTPATTLVGPQLPSRVIASARASNSASNSGAVTSTSPSNINGTPPTASNSAIPSSLEQLLERQWEQGSQFLMEQAQHFDIASLLTCLHQLRTENLRLEEHVNALSQRRDHLLAVNARLVLPLPMQNTTQVNNVHPNAVAAAPYHDNSRSSRVNNTYSSHNMENGLPPDQTSPVYPAHLHRNSMSASSGTQPRHSPGSSGYILSQSPLNAAPPVPVTVSAAAPSVVRSTSETLRAADSTRRSSQQAGYVYQVPQHQTAQVPVVTTQQMIIRRDGVSDIHHQMPSSKPS